jgi:putative methionine-R-sulfoxide reductase with GAF domain
MGQESAMSRDYRTIAKTVETALERAPNASRERRMRAVVDAFWDALHPTGVSWVGFYIPMTRADYDANGQWEGEGMVLGPRRDKPACSPIGMHGACGQAFLSRTTLVVRDVKDLGEHYVACDPRDQSELVIPCFSDDGECWGVLDFDSFDVGSFTSADAEGVVRVLEAAGLTNRVAV